MAEIQQEVVKVGVPVTVRLGHNHMSLPKWFENFLDGGHKGPGNFVFFEEGEGKFTLIFPNERSYAMFLLKWA